MVDLAPYTLAVIIVTVGCGGKYDDIPDDPCAAAPGIRAEMEADVEYWTSPYEDALTARLIPGGFGGMYLEDADTLVLVLVDPGELPKAERQFRTALACGAIYADSIFTRMPPNVISAQDAQYDAIELLEWRILAAVAFSDPDARGLGIDTVRNRVRVDVESADAIDRVRNLVVNAGVPRAALIVEAR